MEKILLIKYGGCDCYSYILYYLAFIKEFQVTYRKYPWEGINTAYLNSNSSADETILGSSGDGNSQGWSQIFCYIKIPNITRTSDFGESKSQDASDLVVYQAIMNTLKMKVCTAH